MILYPRSIIDIIRTARREWLIFHHGYNNVR